jgi:hypothetical protein
MGVYAYNNMGGLLQDMEAGDIDFIVHLGDHAYNLNDGQTPETFGARGDGYLNAFQDVLANMPWMPVLGNHEFAGGLGHAARYTNQTYGIVVGQERSAAGAMQRQAHNLESALNAGITLATAKGAAAQSSGSSRYFSQDVGLVHHIALDMLVYYGTWGGAEKAFRAPQLAWLEADLAAANAPEQRAKVPWVTMNVHHPFYCSSITMGNGKNFTQLGEEPDGFEGCVGTGAATAEVVRKELEPLMLKYGVDVFFAGHEHNYDVSYPVAFGEPTQKNYTNPSAPVHIVTGAGGAPALDHFGLPGPYTRIQKMAWGYGKVVAFNATTLQYTHVLNADNSVFDVMVIEQKAHGSFAPPAPKPPPSALLPGQAIAIDGDVSTTEPQSLVSASGKYQLAIASSDGNLCVTLASGGGTQWCAMSEGLNATAGVFMTDGNFCLQVRSQTRVDARRACSTFRSRHAPRSCLPECNGRWRVVHAHGRCGGVRSGQQGRAAGYRLLLRSRRRQRHRCRVVQSRRLRPFDQHARLMTPCWQLPFAVYRTASCRTTHCSVRFDGVSRRPAHPLAPRQRDVAVGPTVHTHKINQLTANTF